MLTHYSNKLININFNIENMKPFVIIYLAWLQGRRKEPPSIEVCILCMVDFV